jgi:hypothetical protein
MLRSCKFTSDLWRIIADDGSFADADKVRECPSCRKCFTNEFLMPELWWSSYSRRSNGYFGSETFRDDQGDISSLSKQYSTRPVSLY